MAKLLKLFLPFLFVFYDIIRVLVFKSNLKTVVKSIREFIIKGKWIFRSICAKAFFKRISLWAYDIRNIIFINKSMFILLFENLLGHSSLLCPWYIICLKTVYVFITKRVFECRGRFFYLAQIWRAFIFIIIIVLWVVWICHALWLFDLVWICYIFYIEGVVTWSVCEKSFFVNRRIVIKSEIFGIEIYFLELACMLRRVWLLVLSDVLNEFLPIFFYFPFTFRLLYIIYIKGVFYEFYLF